MLSGYYTAGVGAGSLMHILIKGPPPPFWWCSHKSGRIAVPLIAESKDASFAIRICSTLGMAKVGMNLSFCVLNNLSFTNIFKLKVMKVCLPDGYEEERSSVMIKMSCFMIKESSIKMAS